MKFTIIIPVYKVEKYIEKCLISCLNQNIDTSDYEIIVVNDGSPDRSLEIVEHIAKEHNNITIISQTNQGLSAARNAGLELAKGDYVWFIDSDDWIEENCIYDIYELCIKHNLDVLSIDAKYHITSTFEHSNTVNIDIHSPIDGKAHLLSNNWVYPVWLNIVKREFLIKSDLFFMNGILHEDNEFIPRMYYLMDRHMSLNKTLYNVFHNSESITRSVNPKKAFDLLKVAHSQVDFMNNVVKEKEVRTVFCNCVGLAINSALDNTKMMNDFNKESFYLKLDENRYLFNYMKQSDKLKYKFEALLYFLSPNLFKRLYYIFSI
jgi:glycosyltransferase involved in cell wall biosynthesis